MTDGRWPRPAWLVVFGFAHAVGALAVLASMWSFLRSPFVSNDALIAFNASGYRPAMMRVERLIYVPPRSSGWRAGANLPRGSAIGIYYAQGTVEGSEESLYLSAAPPTDARERIEAGDEIRVVYNPALARRRYETGTGARVQRFEPDFADHARTRFHHLLLLAYGPVAALVGLLILLVVATRLATPAASRLRWWALIPLVWLLPVAVFTGFQGVVALATRVVDSK